MSAAVPHQQPPPPGGQPGVAPAGAPQPPIPVLVPLTIDTLDHLSQRKFSDEEIAFGLNLEIGRFRNAAEYSRAASIMRLLAANVMSTMVKLGKQDEVVIHSLTFRMHDPGFAPPNSPESTIDVKSSDFVAGMNQILMGLQAFKSPTQMIRPGERPTRVQVGIVRFEGMVMPDEHAALISTWISNHVLIHSQLAIVGLGRIPPSGQIPNDGRSDSVFISTIKPLAQNRPSSVLKSLVLLETLMRRDSVMALREFLIGGPSPLEELSELHIITCPFTEDASFAFNHDLLPHLPETHIVKFLGFDKGMPMPLSMSRLQSLSNVALYARIRESPDHIATALWCVGRCESLERVEVEIASDISNSPQCLQHLFDLFARLQICEHFLVRVVVPQIAAPGFWEKFWKAIAVADTVAPNRALEVFYPLGDSSIMGGLAQTVSEGGGSGDNGAIAFLGGIKVSLSGRPDMTDLKTIRKALGRGPNTALTITFEDVTDLCFVSLSAK
ncbi:hypothetical protein GQ42DRAFT_162417, partial [Ramicandelaber brevisporus]